MKADVQFINFPKSDLIRSTMLTKISECVEKFADDMVTSVKAFFSEEGLVQHVKISVIAGKINLCVNASASDIAHALDKVLSKLEAALRRTSAKRKHKQHELSHVNPSSDYSAVNLRYEKRSANKEEIIESAFDKFETQYVSDFEDQVRKPSR